MGYGPRATKTDGNTESPTRTKEEPLVQRMAKPNVVTKESPNMQQTSYGPRATKTNGDTEGHAGQVSACSGWATIRGIQRQTAILSIVSGKAKS